MKIKIRLAFIILTIFSLGLLAVDTPTQAVVTDEEMQLRKEQRERLLESRERIMPQGEKEKPESKTPEYVPGEIIIKFKDIEDFADESLQRGIGLLRKSDRTRLDNLEAIFRRHNINQMEPVYKDLRQQMKETGRSELQIQQEVISRREQKMQQRGRPGFSREKRRELEEKDWGFSRVYKLKVDKTKDILPIIDELKKDINIEYAEPNYIARIFYVPNDTRYSEQWAHQKTLAELGWDIQRGDPNVIIAIIDTGVDYNHEDLADNIWRDTNNNPGRDFVDIDTALYEAIGYILVQGEDYTVTDDDPIDYNGHGTHVAGIAAAKGDNLIGVTGVCPNCKIMPVRAGFSIIYSILGEVGSLEYDDIANAITYAVDNGADVINMSFGGGIASSEQKTAIDYAYSQGLVLIAAAGNEKSNKESYPAAFEGVVAVAATAEDDTKTDYSNYGSWVDIAAPGGDKNIDTKILSTVPKTGGILSDSIGYKFLSGTSMASPYVAGLAGLVLAKNQAFTHTEVIDQIKTTVDTISSTYNIGSGRVSVYKALADNETPIFYINDVELEEEGGDGDQIPGSKEKVRLIVYIKNVWKDASLVTATLSKNSEYVSSILYSDSDFGSVAQNEIKDNSSRPFIFQVGSQVVEFETPVEFIMTINADGFTQVLRFEVSLGIRRITKAPSLLGQYGYRTFSISGNKIVWTDYRDGNYDIYLYNLATNVEEPVIVEEGTQTYPAISGNKIAYHTALPFGETDIYLHDLDTNTHEPIAPWGGTRTFPAIDGNNIVWADDRSYDPYNYIYNDIYHCFKSDTNTATVKQITYDNHEFYPQISGNKIAYDSYRINNYDIYLYDATLERGKWITSNTKYQGLPAISGNKIVWEDYRNGNYDIYLYDDTLEKEKQITRSSYSQRYPTISGNKIIWLDNRRGRRDIYMTMVNSHPSVGTVIPSSGSSNPNQTITFTTTYSDPDGYKDIQDALFLINTKINGANCVYLFYQQSTNRLFLRDDANNNWLGGYAPGYKNPDGSDYIIENTYAKLNCSKATVSGSGNILTVKWSLTFKSLFTGDKNTYIYVKDKSGTVDPSGTNGWLKKGTWTITTLTDNAQFISQSVPTTMTAGQTYSVSITMKNTGTSTWTKALNYKLGSENPRDNRTWGLLRVLLSDTDSIAPTQYKTFTFNVTAPTTPGTYNFQWRILKEYVAWFGYKSENVSITVISP